MASLSCYVYIVMITGAGGVSSYNGIVICVMIGIHCVKMRSCFVVLSFCWSFASQGTIQFYSSIFHQRRG